MLGEDEGGDEPVEALDAAVEEGAGVLGVGAVGDVGGELGGVDEVDGRDELDRGAGGGAVGGGAVRGGGDGDGAVGVADADDEVVVGREDDVVELAAHGETDLGAGGDGVAEVVGEREGDGGGRRRAGVGRQVEEPEEDGHDGAGEPVDGVDELGRDEGLGFDEDDLGVALAGRPSWELRDGVEERSVDEREGLAVVDGEVDIAGYIGRGHRELLLKVNRDLLLGFRRAGLDDLDDADGRAVGGDAGGELAGLKSGEGGVGDAEAWHERPLAADGESEDGDLLAVGLVGVLLDGDDVADGGEPERVREDAGHDLVIVVVAGAGGVDGLGEAGEDDDVVGAALDEGDEDAVAGGEVLAEAVGVSGRR